MILSCSKISKSYIDKCILDNVSFGVEENEKVAIVGDNGCGKSTLLKIIMNIEKADDGVIAISSGVTIGYLAQHQDTNSDNTLYDEILSAKEHILNIEHEMNEIQHMMDTASDEELDNLVKRYSTLSAKYEYENGYAYKSEVMGILNGLGFPKEDYNKKLSQFSGGQKTRITLGKLLLTQPDILILDEPTNHLDIESINWLENYLLNYKGSVILVSHDRYFLNKLVTKIVHIEMNKAVTYNGNYSDFQEKYAQRKEIELKHYENQQAEIKHQQQVIDKLKSFNREKSIKRAESRQKALDKIQILDKPINIDHKMKLTFNPKIESGNDVLSVEGLSKSFTTTLFENLSFDIKKGEKVALIGANGTGKTTILKILNKLIPADSGIIKLGTNVTLCYYDQEMAVLDEKNTLFDEISDMRPEMTNTEIRNLLAAFLFKEDDVFKTISSLSGGEKGRLSLAKLMLSNANFLVLDEPTNHLDILSKDILENALNAYSGTVLYVSHDRYFINKTATRILSLNDNQLYNYIGDYDYYLEKKTTVENPIYSSTTDTPGASTTTNSNVNPVFSTHVDNPANISDNKLSWQQAKEQQAKERKRKNDLSKVENEIASIESRIGELDEEIAKPEIASDISKLLPLSKEKEELDTKLIELMEKWEVLSLDE